MGKTVLALGLSLVALTGCAFSTEVQRFGVDYNEALGVMANEQTLLNILRASKGMPTHFTSVSRFTGTLNMRASSSLNSQLRGSGLTQSITSNENTSSQMTTGTSISPTGSTTNNSLVTSQGMSGSAVDAIAEGVDVFTPQIGAELSSGTNFDVQVFDQQKFYQGILGAVPFTTVEMLINQGFDPDLIASLLIARVDFYLKDPQTGGKAEDFPRASYRNSANDRSRFQSFLDCNQLEVRLAKTPPTRIMPISRLNPGKAKARGVISLDELALLDGERFALSSPEGVSPDGSTDDSVYIVKPGNTSRAPRFRERSCGFVVPKTIHPEGVYLNNETALVGVDRDGEKISVAKPVVSEIVFRSPEAVLRAVGDMVRLQGTSTAPTLALCKDGTTTCPYFEKHRKPIFVLLSGPKRESPLHTRFMGTTYSVPADDFQSMQVISIIQQLINLQKESSERALSIPVRAVP